MRVTARQRAAAQRAGALLAAVMLATAPSPAAAKALPERRAMVEQFEILDLVAAAVTAFDNQDIPRFVSYFTPDGVFSAAEVAPSKDVRLDRDAMLQEFGSRPAGAPGDAHHLLSNLRVAFQDARHARLRGCFVRVRRIDGTLTADGMGSYDSVLVKQDGRWKFADYHVSHGGPTPLD